MTDIEQIRDPLAGLTLVRQLEETVVSETGLDIPKEAYEGQSLNDVYMKKRQQADVVFPLIEGVYNDGEVGLVVITGKDVYVYKGDPVSFDSARFAESSPTKPLFMLRPTRVNSQSPMFFERLFPLP